MSNNTRRRLTTRGQPAVTFGSLPVELLVETSTFLHPAERFGRLRAVSRRFHDVLPPTATPDPQFFVSYQPPRVGNAMGVQLLGNITMTAMSQFLRDIQEGTIPLMTPDADAHYIDFMNSFLVFTYAPRNETIRQPVSYNGAGAPVLGPQLQQPGVSPVTYQQIRTAPGEPSGPTHFNSRKQFLGIPSYDAILGLRWTDEPIDSILWTLWKTYELETVRRSEEAARRREAVRARESLPREVLGLVRSFLPYRRMM